MPFFCFPHSVSSLLNLLNSGMKSTQVNINPKIIFFVILAGFLLWIGSQILSVIAILFVAFILNAGLRPLVDRLESYRIPRVVSILGILLLTVAVLALISITIAQEFFAQMGNLITQLPNIVNSTERVLREQLPGVANLIPFDVLRSDLGSLVTNPDVTNLLNGTISGETFNNAVSFVARLFGGAFNLLLNLVTLLMVTIYMLQRKARVQNGLIELLPASWRKSVNDVLVKVEASLGSWLVGQFVLMLAIGVAAYFLVVIPGWFDPNYRLDDFALPIALLAGLLELLPNLGPTLTLIFTCLLAAGTSGLGTVIYIIISFTGMQTAENVLIVPTIMKKAVDLDPIVTILGIIAAFELGGVTAALLAVPVLACAQIVIHEIAKRYNS